jgi:hypothetical protein
MPADLRHSVFGRFHGGGAGDHVGAAVIHFREQAEADVRGSRLADQGNGGLPVPTGVRTA